MTIKEMFELADKRWLAFQRVPYCAPKERRDLKAFILLNLLVPGTRKIVSAAEHDQIWLDVSTEDLEKSGITQEQVSELADLGVFYNDNTDSLSMHC